MGKGMVESFIFVVPHQIKMPSKVELHWAFLFGIIKCTYFTLARTKASILFLVSNVRSIASAALRVSNCWTQME